MLSRPYSASHLKHNLSGLLLVNQGSSSLETLESGFATIVARISAAVAEVFSDVHLAFPKRRTSDANAQAESPLRERYNHRYGCAKVLV